MTSGTEADMITKQHGRCHGAEVSAGPRGLTPVRGDEVCDGQQGVGVAVCYPEAAAVRDGVAAQSPGDRSGPVHGAQVRWGFTAQGPGLARVHRAEEGDELWACRGRTERGVYTHTNIIGVYAGVSIV